MLAAEQFHSGFSVAILRSTSRVRYVVLLSRAGRERDAGVIEGYWKQNESANNQRSGAGGDTG